MNLESKLERELMKEVEVLKRKNIDLEHFATRWDLHVERYSKEAIDDIGNYATIMDDIDLSENLGYHLVSVDIPIVNLISLLKKDYVKSAEPSSYIQAFSAA